jgi:hypothetical protein
MPRRVRALRRRARSVYSGGPFFRGLPYDVECDRTPGCECRGPWLAGLQKSIPSDPGIRGPLHPRRLRYPPSPYRGGYASAGCLAGRGASTLSVHVLFRNGPLEAGGLPIRYARDHRPLAAGSARRDFFLAPQAALRNPPHRLGAPVAGVSPWVAPGGRKDAGCGFASGVPLPRSLRRRTHPPFAGNGTLRGGRHT